MFLKILCTVIEVTEVIQQYQVQKLFGPCGLGNVVE